MTDSIRNALIYRESARYARLDDKLNEWRKSHNLNIECKNEAEALISENFDGMHLKIDVGKALAEKYGLDRTEWVLANTIQHHMSDGRFDNKNKEWAKGVNIPNEDFDHTREYSINSHPEIVNGVVNQYRRHVESLGILNRDVCLPREDNENYEDKLLILNPSALSDEYRKGEFQYFFAESGFGCAPDKIGRKVFGRFLSDGESAQFSRGDFLGVADETKLPDWAVKKLQKLVILGEQDEGMGGIS